MLVHGFTGGRVDFADVIDELATDRRVVAWDHRGHADSTNTGDPATYTFDQLADDMGGVLEELGIASFHLLGHSMGGVVAQRYTLAHPAPVQSLILMDTAGEAMGGIPPELIEATVAKGRAKGMPAVAASMRRMLEDAPLPEDSRERILDRLVHKLSNMDVEAFAALGRALGEYPSMLERLGREVDGAGDRDRRGQRRRAAPGRREPASRRSRSRSSWSSPTPRTHRRTRTRPPGWPPCRRAPRPSLSPRSRQPASVTAAIGASHHVVGAPRTSRRGIPATAPNTSTDATRMASR